MKLLWPVLLIVFRTLYFLYSLWCLLFPFALIGFFVLLAQDHAMPGIDAGTWKRNLLIAYAVFSAGLLGVIYSRRTPGDPTPFQSAFLSWFGTLRGFWNVRPGDMVKLKLPSGYLVENPQAYRISGHAINGILSHIQPGDILLRGYDGYVDGIMIRKASVCSQKKFEPGWFTHAALYVGELTEQDRRHVPEKMRHDARYFQPGAQMVIHAMAKGVHSQDLLTFCRCDYLTILRVNPAARFNGAPIDAAAVVEAARLSALQK